MTTSTAQPSSVADRLLEKLACPRCRESLRWVPPGALHCAACGRAFPVEGGIPLLFPEEGPADWTVSQQELYDGIAPHYDGSIPQHVALHYRHKRVQLVRRLSAPRSAVLDVGCGTGTLARGIHGEGYDVYGLDASTGMLAQLVTGPPTAAQAGATDVTDLADTGPLGVAGFCERLPFATGAFDLSITVATLHHVSDPQRIAEVIAEMCRVTRAGGHVVIWDHNPKNPYWPLLMKRVPQDTGEERLVPQEEIVGDLRAAGVSDVTAQRSGLVPDFTPPALLGVVRLLESVVERAPGLNVFCAHNVVVARKPR
jgi:SAM-dependent methyltransferase